MRETPALGNWSEEQVWSLSDLCRSPRGLRSEQRVSLSTGLVGRAGVSGCLCLGRWLNRGCPAMIPGSVWMALGIAFGVWKTCGFRNPLPVEIPDE